MQVRLDTPQFAYDYKDDLQLRIIQKATTLKGKKVGLTIEGIAKVFKLHSTKTIAGGNVGYNIAITKYFVREKKSITPLVLAI